MKLLVVFALIFGPLFLMGQPVSPAIAEPTGIDKVLSFIKEIDGLNIALIAFATIAGGLWAMGRAKLREIGELFLKAYEYTDDKRLSKAERQDLMQRFLRIIGRSTINETTVKKSVKNK